MTPALSKVAISRRSLAEAWSTASDEGGAGALAEPQVEVEQRLEAEVLEGGARPGLDRAVAGEQVLAAVRAQIDTAISAAAPAMTPSTITGTRAGRAADDEAGERGDLEAADLLEQGQRAGGALHPFERASR